MLESLGVGFVVFFLLIGILFVLACITWFSWVLIVPVFRECFTGEQDGSEVDFTPDVYPDGEIEVFNLEDAQEIKSRVVETPSVILKVMLSLAIKQELYEVAETIKEELDSRG